MTKDDDKKKDEPRVFDFADYDTVKHANAGAWMPVLLPTGEKTDSRIKLIGADSKQYADVKNRIAKRVARRTGERIEPDELDDTTLELVAACVTEFDNVVVGGKTFEASEASAEELFRRFPWIRDQAVKFIHDRMNYLGN